MKWQLPIMASLAMASQLLMAESSTLGAPGQPPAAYRDDIKKSFFELSMASAQVQSISRAKLKNDPQETRVGYNQWNLNLASIDGYSDESAPVSVVRIGLQSSRLSWRSSPYYSSSPRYSLNLDGSHLFELGLPFTLQVDGRVAASLQSAQVGRYGMASFDAYARYQCEKAVLKAGAYAEVGRHSRWLLPVLGIETPLQGNFSLDLLFPFHGTLNYSLNEGSNLFVALRSNKDRQRVGSSSTTSHGIWEYRAPTVAFGTNWRYEEMFKLDAEVGETLSPRLRCYNSQGHHLATYKARNSLFAQLSLSIVF